MEIKLGTNAVRTIIAFERITKVQPKDCLIKENSIYFLVDPQKIGMVIGKDGNVVKELRKIFGKSVKIFGYAKDPENFLKSIIPNINSLEINNGSIVISIASKDKVAVIGKNGENINAIREILKRHFSIEKFKLR